MIKLLFILLSFYLFSFAPVFSQNLSDVLRLQLLNGWRAESGKHISGLEINLLPGWKTYWRKPGDSGLIPNFDWGESENLSAVKIFWPHPTIFYEGSSKTIGYKNRVILPIEFTPLNSSKVVKPKLKITLGVCKDLCIPISRVLRTKLRPSKKTIDQEIMMYLNLRPKLVLKAEISSINCRIKVVNDTLFFKSNIKLINDIPDIKAVAVELPDSNLWFEVPTFKKAKTSLEVFSKFQNFGEGPLLLNRSGIIITLFYDTRSVYLRGC